VAIAGGGRAALTRVAAALGHINLGHFLPDYTAYEELLDIFRMFASIPILLEPEKAYVLSATDLRREILGRGLGVLLLSNPTNPTGKVVAGEELRGWVAACREVDCSLIVDEFYSQYVVRRRTHGERPPLLEDVNRDPVMILDGLTKNWRYPGWRVAWILAPPSVIEAVSSAGSFLDGGGSRPLPRAALPLLTAAWSAGETAAIHSAFRPKRDMTIARLTAMGVRIDLQPEGTFYGWGSVAGLPPRLSTGMDLFRAGLNAKVITVPGEFFDVNPGKRRARAARASGPTCASPSARLGRWSASASIAWRP
jgi:aspartate/methionine/tyrosine aminotransferase